MIRNSKLLGHAVHPMLIVFPLGLLATAVAFDIAGIISGDTAWFRLSFWLIAAGILGGLLAAPFGLVDWLAIPKGSRAKIVGLCHGAGNAIVLLLFAVSWFLRRPAPQDPRRIAFVLSFVGVVSVLGTAWLGGELVNRLGSGVDAGKDAIAPNSHDNPHDPGDVSRAA